MSAEQVSREFDPAVHVDSTGQYLRAVGSRALLSADEALELARAMHGNDATSNDGFSHEQEGRAQTAEEARQQLIEATYV